MSKFHNENSNLFSLTSILESCLVDDQLFGCIRVISSTLPLALKISEVAEDLILYYFA